LIFLAVLLGPSLAHATCALPTTARDIATAVNDVDQAFVAMDINTFNEAEARATSGIECLEEALTPYDAAGVHRSTALRAFIVRDTDAARTSYATALAAQPNFNLPIAIAPEGNSLHQLYAEARELSEEKPDRIALEVPRGTVLLVDGRRVQMRPLNRPAVIQLVDLQGTVLWSRYVPERGIEPDFSEFEGAIPDVASSQPPVSEGRISPKPEPRTSFRIESQTRTPRGVTRPPASTSTRKLVAGAAGATVVAAVFYATALSTASTYHNTQTPYKDLDTLRSRTNGLVVASGAIGAVGLGLGAYAFITW
jgi:hypothetical protein